MKRKLRPEIRKAVSYITTIVAVVCFIIVIGYVGSCDNNVISLDECTQKSLPYLITAGVSTLLSVKIGGM